jgi:hypothetical protein
MFKALGNLIHKTPWWGLILGGSMVLLGLVMFAIPIQVIRLSESGATPEEQRAIEREINLAFGDRALNFAEGVVHTMRERATDPDRQRELDQALAEMARARDELTMAQGDISRAARESAKEAADAAMETAIEAAQSGLDAAVEAREAIEEAKNEALDKLRNRNLDVAPTAKSFDDMLKSARENEQTARESLESLRAAQRQNSGTGSPVGPVPPVPPVKPAPNVRAMPRFPDMAPLPEKGEAPSIPPLPDRSAFSASAPTLPLSALKAQTQHSGLKIDMSLPSVMPLAPLSESMRDDIRARVANDVWRVGVGSVLILTFIPVFIMLLISKYFIGRSRRALAFAEEKKQEAKVSAVERQITEARLQALQAQVEPHFLYNTLANVQALTEFDPAAANQMVGHLIQYLRASLPKMRENTSTVGQEIELVRAYLNILKMRMGARLEFAIDVPDELLGKSFPPMMLPSLVENAIKHGLEPQREGGRIDVVATRVETALGDRICLQVKDTGKGLSDTPIQTGGGVGLSNLRERLSGLYGGNGRFSIASNEPQGVVATIDIPAEVPVQKTEAEMAAMRGGGAPNPQPQPPLAATGWRRAWAATSRTHSLWAWIVSRTFLALMLLLCAAFLLALLGLYTGWMPVDFVGLPLDGLEGKAVGSVGLLAAFGAVALAILVVVAVLYGLGFLLAGLLIFIPVVVVISLFPVLSPFILIGLGIWWFTKKRRGA